MATDTQTGLAFSIALHGAALVAGLTSAWVSAPIALDAPEQAITVSLSVLPPQPVTTPMAEPIPLAEPVVAPEPKAIPEPEQSRTSPPKPTIRRVSKPQPSKAVTPMIMMASTYALPSQTNHGHVTKAAYESRLAAHIERHKRYPRRARQLRLEGSGTVMFDVLENGFIGQMRVLVSSGHSLLDDEMQATLMRAQPLPVPPAGQQQFTLPMRFALQ